MRTIAHIVNPVIVGESSDLFVAQPITFRTMEIAQRRAKGRVDVELFTAQYAEDRALIPGTFTATPDLTRAVTDIVTFRHPRKLPLLRDILDRLYEATEAEYLIYTNVDIGLVPQFYIAVNAFIENGADAFSINRRTISGRFTSTREIQQMYLEVAKGQPHPGNDCFVFRRDTYPKYKLGYVCVGMNWVGKTLLNSMGYHTRSFRKYADPQLTFHIGDQRTWHDNRWADYRNHNTREMTSAYMRLRRKGRQHGTGTGTKAAPAPCHSDTGDRALGAIELAAPASPGRRGMEKV